MLSFIKGFFKPNAMYQLNEDLKKGITAEQTVKDKKFYDAFANMLATDNNDVVDKIKIYKEKIDDILSQQKSEIAKDTATDCDSTRIDFKIGNDYDSLLNTYSFIPFAALAMLSQIPLVYNACDTYAKELTRAGYEFVAINPTDADERIIGILKDEFRLFDCDKIIFKMSLKTMIFGGAMLYPKYKNDDKNLKEDLKLDSGIAPDSLEYFQVIEPTWCFPTTANYAYPLEADFYTPTMYNIMGKDIHPSRLYKMVYNDVPDLIRPIYMHYGISLIQKIIGAISDYVDVKNTIKEIINRFNLVILKVQMTEYKNNFQKIIAKAKNFTRFRSNFGVMITDKDNEDIEQITMALTELNALWGRFIEVMCMQIQIPVTKWTGISPGGFSNSDDSGHQNWYDLILALDNEMLKPAYDRMIRHVLLNKGIDTLNYTVKFKKLEETTQLEEAQIRESDSRVDVAYVNAGIISSQDVAKTLQDAKESKYTNIDILTEEDKQERALNDDIEQMNEKEAE